MYSIKDSLLHQQPYSKSVRQRQNNSKPSARTSNNNNKAASSQVPSNGSVTSTDIQIRQTNIGLNDVDEILESLFELADRAGKLLNILTQLKKLSSLQPLVIGLPRAEGGNKETREESVSDVADRDIDSTNSSEKFASTDGSVGNEGEELRSIAETVAGCIKDVLDCLRRGCPHGSKEVFVTSGKEKPVFPLVYLEYQQLIECFEETVCKYLLVS